jgi:hypothetical protein
MQHDEIPKDGSRPNSCEAGRRTAAQDSLQNRLGLIVGMVGEEHALKTLGPNNLPEQSHPRGSISGGRIVQQIAGIQRELA